MQSMVSLSLFHRCLKTRYILSWLGIGAVCVFLLETCLWPGKEWEDLDGVVSGRFGNMRVSSAFFLPLRFTALRLTKEGNQIMADIDVRSLRAGQGHRRGIFISCPVLRAVIPMMGKFAKLRMMLLPINKFKSFCKQAFYGLHLKCFIHNVNQHVLEFVG